MRRRFVTLDVFTASVLPATRWRWCTTPTGSTRRRCRRLRASSVIPRPFSCCRPRTGAPCAHSHLHAGAGIAVRRPSNRRDGGAARPARWRRRRRRHGSRRGDRAGAVRHRVGWRRTRQRPLRRAAIAGRGRPRARQRGHRRGPPAFARRDRVWRFATVALVGRQPPSLSCRSPGLPPLPAAVLIRRSSTRPSAKTGRPTYSAARRSSPATHSTPACSPPPWAIPEDPATGSAAAAFAGVLAPLAVADGSHAVAIEQGYEMGRPSLIAARIGDHAGKFVSVSIGGEAVIVTEGTIEA